MPLGRLRGRRRVDVRLLEERDHGFDVLPLRRMPEDAHPQYVAPRNARRRDEADAAPFELGYERGVSPILFVLVAGEAAAEADHREGRQSGDLERRRLVDPLARGMRQVETAVDRRREGID